MVESSKRTLEKLIVDIDGSLHYNSHLNAKFIDHNEREFRIGLVKSIAEDCIIDIDDKTR